MAVSVLDDIVASVRRRLELHPAPADLFDRAAADAAERPRRGFAKALAAPGPSVIAECKHASPSAGVIREPFDAVVLAKAYAAGGARAISVVTEVDHFQGRLEWVGAVRSAVDLPVLRKDFIVEKRQIAEAAVAGADAVLLIHRCLDRKLEAELLAYADELGLDILLELFADEDPGPAIDSGARILGVNARDLGTMQVDITRQLKTVQLLPEDRIRVAESGLSQPRQIQELAAAGWDAFLIGEHLVRQADPEAEVRRLLEGR